MNPFSPSQRRQVFGQLMQTFHTAAPADIATRWACLEAAHVLGQRDFALHWACHTAMLRFALQTRDPGEVAGQLLRLALVPLGHLVQRLPADNPGRAAVSVFAAMPVEARLSELIRQAAAARRLSSF